MAALRREASNPNTSELGLVLDLLLHASLVKDISERNYNILLRKVGKESMRMRNWQANPSLREAASNAEENLKAAEEALVESGARTSTEDAMQSATTAVEDAKRAHDVALRCLGEEALKSPEGRGQVNPVLLEAERAIKRDLEEVEITYNELAATGVM
ncbi:hypothetical protein DFH11DRAFT_1639461 [Phellopilus nigrolimitatus]|nr:hypothetical protein DFH11DRAFT_1639461 [Phellopilus nigrolimitatus]